MPDKKAHVPDTVDATVAASISAPVTGKKNSVFRGVIRRLSKNGAAMTGFAIFVLFVLLSVFSPLIAPYGYEEMDIPNAFLGPSWQHLCGTDNLGRDIFSRLLYGGRFSIGLGLTAQVFMLTIGVGLGCIAGYFGGKIETIIMRFCDIWQAMPQILLAIIISTVLGGGFLNTVIAMGVGGIPPGARMIRAQFLQLREQEFVEAAKAVNCSTPRIILKHILPNAISPMIVGSTMAMGNIITGAAQLSYIGLGVQPPTPEWGAMLVSGREYIRYYPHMILFPGLCLAIVILAMNMFGDGLRDAMDPKLKN